MKKVTYRFTAEIVFTGKKNVPYCVNGLDMNTGDATEIAIKSALKLTEKKDGNGAYDQTDDIPQFHASVKSSHATLVNKQLGIDFESTLDIYFKNVHSKAVWYGVPQFEQKTVTVYKMSHEEFRQYLKLFATFDSSRKVIRLNRDAKSKNLYWLKEQVEA